MWRSVFQHEFIDRIGNFQALSGQPTSSSLQLAPSDAVVPGVNAVAISPGKGFEYVLETPLTGIVGVSARVRLIYPLSSPTAMFSVVRLGGAAELLFWPQSHPLPDMSGTVALARVWVGSGFRNLGNVVLPAKRFMEFRFDWHASGQARIVADGQLVAYHNAVAPGAILSFDRVAFGMGNVQPPTAQPRYHVSRVFVRALSRHDSLAHLSKLLPPVVPEPDVNRCRQRIITNALAVVDKLRAFMTGVHANLSQPWTAQAGPADGPFQPQAIEAHALATAALGALVAMLRTGDFTVPEGFLDPFGSFLRIARDAQPQAFAGLASEIDAMVVVPEDCRNVFEPTEEDEAAFAPIIEILTRANDLIHAIAGGN